MNPELKLMTTIGLMMPPIRLPPKVALGFIFEGQSQGSPCSRLKFFPITRTSHGVADRIDALGCPHGDFRTPNHRSIADPNPSL
jgi:hypothetical protein